MAATDAYFTIAGFLVGALIGVTGVGGGSLMTPMLILLFGVAPATAVGTDLLFAAATKTLGSIVHGYHGTIAWQIVRRLAAGSVPATAVTLALLSSLQMSAGGARHLITIVLCFALLLTAAALILREQVATLYRHRLAGFGDRAIARLTIAMGAALGVMVTISSVGAGAIGVTVLVLLYPRISAARIVGSDIAHAVPLTLIAGLGHGAMRALDLRTLLWLLCGSLPGIFLGSALAARVPDAVIRYTLAAVLLLVGVKLAIEIPAHSAPAIEASAMRHL